MIERELVEGGMYRIVVQIPGVWKVPREACMKLIFVLEDQYEGQTLVFSARPRFGDDRVNMKHVTELERQPDNAKVYTWWKVGDRPPEKWDYER